MDKIFLVVRVDHEINRAEGRATANTKITAFSKEADASLFVEGLADEYEQNSVVVVPANVFASLEECQEAGRQDDVRRNALAKLNDEEKAALGLPT